MAPVMPRVPVLPLGFVGTRLSAISYNPTVNPYFARCDGVLCIPKVDSTVTAMIRGFCFSISVSGHRLCCSALEVKGGASRINNCLRCHHLLVAGNPSGTGDRVSNSTQEPLYYIT